MVCVNQIIMIYILNLYSAICQLHINKLEVKQILNKIGKGPE